MIYKEKACITMFIDWLNTCTTFPTNQKYNQNPSGLAYAFSLFVWLHVHVFALSFDWFPGLFVIDESLMNDILLFYLQHPITRTKVTILFAYIKRARLQSMYMYQISD